MKTISTVLCLAAVLSTTAAFAQQSTTTSTTPENTAAAPTTSVTTVDVKPIVKTSSPWIISAKSSIDSGRKSEQEKKNAVTMSAKNEVQFGYRHDSGWGGFINLIQYYKTYTNVDAKAKNVWQESDHSITLIHPDFYKSDSLLISGQLRYYIRTSLRSETQEINHFAYYFRQSLKLSDNHEIYNELVPRLYTYGKTVYPTDTTQFVEDFATYNYKLSSSWRIGVKQWSQYEMHDGVSPAFSMEAGPSATYTFNRNLSITPSLSFPLIVETYKKADGTIGGVYDAATAVATDQARANLFIQARF